MKPSPAPGWLPANSDLRYREGHRLRSYRIHTAYIPHMSTAKFPDDCAIDSGKLTAMMTREELVARIDAAKAKMGQARSKDVSDRELSLAVTGKPDFVRYLRDGRGADPSATQLQRLAEVMGLDPYYFIDGERTAISPANDLDLIKLAFRAADRQMADYRGSMPDEFRADLAAAIFNTLRQYKAQGRSIDADTAMDLVSAVFQTVAAELLKKQ